MRFGLKRTALRKLVYSRATIVVLAVLVVLLGIGVFNAYQTASRAEEKRAEREAVLQNLKERQAALSREIEQLETERGIEAEIRTKYDVGHEGEGVIVIVDAPANEANATTTDERGFFSRILDFFF